MNLSWTAEEDKMAFSPENQRWVQDEIARSIRDAIHPPGRLRKFVLAARDAGWLATIWAIPLALLGGLIALGIAITNRNETNALFRQHTEDRLTGIEMQMGSLRALVSASNPTRKVNQDAARELIIQAKQKTIPPLQATAVEEAGKSFIEASTGNEGAWRVALEFVQYRSVLNESDFSAYHWGELTSPSPHEWDIKNEFHGTRIFTTREGVPCAEGSIQAHIGSKVSGTCAEYMLFVGGQVPPLDSNHFKNTIFQNVRISYLGGPLILENVSFINCTFDFPKPEPRAIRLASAILSSVQVNIKERA
jgi:hypothetical protein